MNNLVPLRRAEPAWTDQLRTEGYCIIPDALPVGAIAALETDLDPVFAATPFCRGRFYGERTKRFGSLLKRSPHAAQLVLNPMILSMVEEILVPACDRIPPHVAPALEIHPGEIPQFPPRPPAPCPGAQGTPKNSPNCLLPSPPFP